jgi:hypothetical protein
MIFPPWRNSPRWAKASSLSSLQHHRYTTLRRLLWTSDEPNAETSTWTTHTTHNRQSSMPPAEFEPTIPASGRAQIHALDRAATGIGTWQYIFSFHVLTSFPFQFSFCCSCCILLLLTRSHIPQLFYMFFLTLVYLNTATFLQLLLYFCNLQPCNIFILHNTVFGFTSLSSQRSICTKPQITEYHTCPTTDDGCLRTWTRQAIWKHNTAAVTRS